MRLTIAIAALFAATPTLAAREPPLGLGVGLICGAETAPKPQGSPALTRLEGMGSGGMAADTEVAEAKAWFDYGLKLYHAFYHEEAKQAFAKAAAADPKCAACAWGVALSLGATLNTAPGPAEAARASATWVDEGAVFSVAPSESATPQAQVAHLGSSAAALAKACLAS